jgi:hypothetical protein
MRLPGICVSRPAEENLRQLSVTRFGQTSIERTECEPEPLTALWGQRIRRALELALAQHAAEPECGGAARGETRIEGDQCGERVRSSRAANHHGGYPAGFVPNYEIYAIAGDVRLSWREAGEICDGAKPWRRGRKKNGGLIEMREPEHVDPVGPLRRVDREILAPTVRRAPPRRPIGAPCGIRGDNRDFGGGIPTRVQGSKDRPHSHRRRLTANSSVLAFPSPCVTPTQLHAAGACSVNARKAAFLRDLRLSKSSGCPRECVGAVPSEPAL